MAAVISITAAFLRIDGVKKMDGVKGFGACMTGQIAVTHIDEMNAELETACSF